MLTISHSDAISTELFDGELCQAPVMNKAQVSPLPPLILSALLVLTFMQRVLNVRTGTGRLLARRFSIIN